jgi:hypothetical protein
MGPAPTTPLQPTAGPWRGGCIPPLTWLRRAVGGEGERRGEGKCGCCRHPLETGVERKRCLANYSFSPTTSLVLLAGRGPRRRGARAQQMATDGGPPPVNPSCGLAGLGNHWALIMTPLSPTDGCPVYGNESCCPNQSPACLSPTVSLE